MTNTFLIAFVTVAVLVAVQYLISNKPGSEDKIRELIEQVSGDASYFVALQYYGGMLNRTYVVFATDEFVCGAKVRGALPAPINPDERWHDPLFYPTAKHLMKIGDVSLGSSGFLSADKSNFRIERKEIRNVEFSSKEKWGMGSVPYSGRVFITDVENRTLELILLGKQDGKAIEKLLT